VDPEIRLSDDDRWQLLERCLSDDELPLDVRAAGALLLLYGLPLNRIVELTTEQVSPEGIRISPGAQVIAVPPALRRLLDQLPPPPRIPSAVALISRQALARGCFLAEASRAMSAHRWSPSICGGTASPRGPPATPL
jgi:hypothetical protein